MDLLMRGSSILVVTQGEKINVRVHSLYKLAMCLPMAFDVEDSKAFFDCKTRVLGIVLPVSGMHITTSVEDEVMEPVEVQETT